MLFDLTVAAPRPRRGLLAASVLLHLAAAGALLALPLRPIPKALPTATAVVFFPAPKVAPLESSPMRPRPAPAPPRKLMEAQRRAGPRTLALAAQPLPVRREAEPQPELRPIVMQGLTLQSTARAASSDLRLPSGGGALTGQRIGSAPAGGGGGVGRLVDAGDVTEPPAVVARAELRKFYPPKAVQNRFEGDVKLRLLVAEDGSLAQVDVLRDPGEGLGEAGARAIRSYRFRPARVNGEPVATIINFTLHFVLG